MFIVRVSASGKPSFPPPVLLVTMRSWQPPCGASYCGTASLMLTGHEKLGRSMYQPSDSIDMFDCAQASGEDSIFIDVFNRRAVTPNICFRSPVSVILLAYVTVPPRFTGV